MSVINHKTFVATIRTKLLADLNDNVTISRWFERIITLAFLDARGILTIDNYDKKTIIALCHKENQLLKGIFNTTDMMLEALENNYPDHFYTPEMITLLKSNITKDTPITMISDFQEDFKDHERYMTFNAYNHQSLTIVDKDNITTVTQIFTPSFLAKWLASKSLLDLDFKKAKILDPSLGTGDLLLEVFEVLLAKYKPSTQDLKKTIKHIYKEQLFGFDIDEGVIIFAKFLFMMKAFEICPSYLDEEMVLPNFICLSKLKTFQDIDLIGSLYNIPPLELAKLSKEEATAYQLLKQKYEVVITNPPYMGRKILPSKLSNYLKNNYHYGKSELYTAFIEKGLAFLNDGGKLAMLTLHTWMFIKSFSSLRKYIINHFQIEEVLHLGKNTFENLNAYNALACSFVIKKTLPTKQALFVRLTDYENIKAKEQGYYVKNNYYYIDQHMFLNLAYAPFLYWLDNKQYQILLKSTKLGSVASIRQGLATGDNKEYLRWWYEVEQNAISFDSTSLLTFWQTNKKYVPYNKGGDKTKWYKTSGIVIRFDKKAYQALAKQGNHLPSKEYYFKEGITWSLFGFNSFNVRYKEAGYVFDVSGSSLFVKKDLEAYILAFLSSKVAFFYLSALAPTVNFQVGNIASLPLIIDYSKKAEITTHTIELIALAKQLDKLDELSWHYEANEFYTSYDSQKTLLENLDAYQSKINNIYTKISTHETKIDELFQIIYDLKLQDKTYQEVKMISFKDIICEMLSYLVGVVLGRYHIAGYQSNLKTDDFVALDEVVSEIKQLIYQKMPHVKLEEIQNILNMTIDNYFEKHFAKSHIQKYHNLPIYWYKKINNQTFIGYYHNLVKTYKLDSIQGIKKNYNAFDLIYNIKN